MDALPEGDGWQYEPKWDGFRGIAENLDREFHLWSRNGRPLLRYFPELSALGELLPPRSAVDGEIVVVRDGALDFDALQMRLHPAESRVKRLSAEIPAQFVCFDVLLWDGEDLHGKPFSERRAKVETLPFDVSPSSRDAKEAARWLERLEVAGFDGVIAKRVDSAVPARLARGGAEGEGRQDRGHGRRRRDLEREGHRDRQPRARALVDGELRPVGSAPATGKKRAEILERVEPLLGPNPERKPRGAPSRWKPKADLRVELGPARARRRGALRQVAEGPHPPQRALPPLPPRQGPGPVHGRPGPPAAEEGRPDGRGPAHARITGCCLETREGARGRPLVELLNGPATS